jgi:dihydropyrimidinase
VVTASEMMAADVGITGGKVAALGAALDATGAETIDATGQYVMPGGVEIHTHIDGILHGMRTVDDWFYASLGAAAGGTTTVVDFPMQAAGQTLPQVIDEYCERASGKAVVDYAFTPIVSQFTDQTWADIPRLIAAGMPTFKFFMYYDWKVDDFALARALDVVGSNGGLVSIHCETAGVIDYLIKRALAEGQTGVEWHAPTRPVSTEVDATARVMQVAGELGVPVLVVHMSAAPAVAELAKARARGVQAYGEAMPHFLLLDETRYAAPGYEAMKVVITPPLRAKEHQAALWAALRAGVLATVGSDHCAFPYQDKVRLFETRGAVFPMIPHGAPGIETRLPLLFSEGVSAGRLSLTRFVEVIAANPARLAGLYPRKGSLAVGADADVVLVDPQRRVTLSQRHLHGRTDYTPFEGWQLTGYPTLTLSRGKVVVRDGAFVGQAGHGQFLKRDAFKPF